MSRDIRDMKARTKADNDGGQTYRPNRRQYNGMSQQNGIGIDEVNDMPAERRRTTQNGIHRQDRNQYTHKSTANMADVLDGFDDGIDEPSKHREAASTSRRFGNRDSANNVIRRDARQRASRRIVERQVKPTDRKTIRTARRKAGRVARFTSVISIVLIAVLCGYDIAMTRLAEAVSDAKGGSVTIPADDIINMAKAAIPEPEPDDSIDWASLLARNSEVKAWMDLQVGDVGIHEPVVQPSTVEGNSYYLKHDLDRRSTYIGNIFYDMRDSDEGTSRLAYGHHFTGSTKMLSSINDAYNQSKFDMIQPMRWRQPDGTDDIYVPVMAMKVYKTYQKCQSFTARTSADTQLLLQTMGTDAQAKANDFNNIINSAERCITFVTCASNVPNQPWRTLVVFAKLI